MTEVISDTAQGLRQASVRVVTGTSNDYNGDWQALFIVAGVDVGSEPDFNGAMLAWLNKKLSASYTDLEQAQNALATANGAYNWSSLGTFDASTGGVSNAIFLEDGVNFIELEDGSGVILLDG